MRIWIINQYAAPPTQAGITRQYHFARQLILLGHEVTIVAANYNHFTRSSMSLSHSNCNDMTYVPFIWVSVPPYRGNSLARFWNMLVFSWRILRKKYLPRTVPPDIIIGSSPHLFAAYAAEILARRLKKTFIFEVRDLWPDTLVDLGRFSHKHPLIRLMKRIEMYLYRQSKYVISLLPNAQEYLVQCGVKAANILWLPNAVDTDFIPQNSIKPRNQKFTLMYAGSHGLANDLDTLIMAGKILQEQGLASQIRICLIGDGPEKNSLMKLAADHQVNIVEFLSPVPKNEIYTTLLEADAFLMPLKNLSVFRWGISPNKLYDYMVMGRPVLFAVDTPFNPVLKANAGLSIQPCDPKSLATALHTLSLLSQEELYAMGQRGRDFALQYHSIVPLTALLEKFLKKVLYEVEGKNIGVNI